MAMFAFWKYGYEGTSYELLRSEMNLTAPQIYSAFGNKEALFFKALDIYLKEEVGFFREIMSQKKPIKERLSELIDSAAKFYSDKSKPRGCLSTAATFSKTKENELIIDLLTLSRKQSEKLIVENINAAVESGELPRSTGSESIGKFVSAILQGMSIQARDGAKEKELKDYAQFAIRGAFNKNT
jgi:AcrR family transcriptional regulator